MKAMGNELLADESGQTLVEYGMLIGLMAIVCITILAVLGKKSRDVFTQTNTRITSTS